MPFTRYENDTLIKNNKLLSTNQAVSNIRQAVKNGQLDINTLVMSDATRLDIVAGEIYGDGRLWWLLAAASNIGWWPQVPAGTLIRVPTNLAAVEELL